MMIQTGPLRGDSADGIPEPCDLPWAEDCTMTKFPFRKIIEFSPIKQNSEEVKKSERL